MLVLFLRRFGLFCITLFLSTLMVFIITQYLPGDPARIILGREAGEAALEQLRQELGLDQPLPLQYLHWALNFIQGNWGISYSTKTPILPLVLLRLRNSFFLTSVALLIALPLGVGLGILAGLWANKPLDFIISGISLSFLGLPEFISGMILIEIFSFRLKILPANSSITPQADLFQVLPQLILPALTETMVLLAYFVRLTRAGIISELNLPYVRTAKLKGLPYGTIVFKHVLRNALLPLVTVAAMSFGWLIGGLVVTENVFNYPGLGRLLVFAIERRDYPLMQAVSMITLTSFMVANFLADICYILLNPRIRIQDR